MEIIIKEYNFTYKVDLEEGATADEFISSFMELAGKVYHAESVDEYLKELYDKS